MKFLTKLEANKFLSEVMEFEKIGNVDENYQPTNEEITRFIKSRTNLVKKLKDSKRASAQKSNWRQNRYKMMKGIKAFHKSTEGKRFHKRLGRFLATRLFKRSSLGKTPTSEALYEDLLIKQSYLKGLNAAKQHLFVELEYFHTLEEQVDIELFVTDYAIPMFQKVEEKVLKDKALDEDDIAFLCDITEDISILGAIEKETGKKFAQIKEVWNSIINVLEKDNVKREESEDFYSELFKKLKEKLGK